MATSDMHKRILRIVKATSDRLEEIERRPEQRAGREPPFERTAPTFDRACALIARGNLDAPELRRVPPPPASRRR